MPHCFLTSRHTDSCILLLNQASAPNKLMKIKESHDVIRMFKVSLEINCSQMASMSSENSSPKRIFQNLTCPLLNKRVLEGKLL